MGAVDSKLCQNLKPLPLWNIKLALRFNLGFSLFTQLAYRTKSDYKEDSLSKIHPNRTFGIAKTYSSFEFLLPFDISGIDVWSKI